MIKKTVLLVDDENHDVIDTIKKNLKDGWHVDGVFPLEWVEWTSKIDDEESKTWGYVTKAVLIFTKTDDDDGDGDETGQLIRIGSSSGIIHAIRDEDGSLHPLKKKRRWWKGK